MTALFLGCGKKLFPADWRQPALLLALVLGFAGCRAMDGPGEGLRKNDLSAPARQVRATENTDKTIDNAKASKSTDDFLMSSEAKNIYHNMD